MKVKRFFILRKAPETLLDIGFFRRIIGWLKNRQTVESDGLFEFG